MDSDAQEDLVAALVLSVQCKVQSAHQETVFWPGKLEAPTPNTLKWDKLPPYFLAAETLSRTCLSWRRQTPGRANVAQLYENGKLSLARLPKALKDG